MKTLGLVCARSGSKRLPLKNALRIGKRTMADLAVWKLLKAGVSRTFLCTDKPELFEYTRIIKRPEELSGDDVPLQDVVRWCYKLLALEEDYDCIALLMPNAPYIEIDDIKKGLDMAATFKYSIIRSYNEFGDENGLYFIMPKKVFGSKWDYDVYTGALFTKGIEIHTLEEFKEAEMNLKGKYA
jgi:CMP-N-acetylneuraminic acid synthetase